MRDRLAHEPRRRRNWIAAAAAAAVVLIATVAFVALSATSSNNHRHAAKAVPVNVADLTNAQWNELDPGPLAERRDVISAVWTGDELLVQTRAANSTYADNYAYSPATEKWRPLAQAPIEWRQDAVSIWTGSRWIIWSGSYFAPSGDQSIKVPANGAMYDPSTNTWSPIPDAPIGGKADAAGVWTGTELIVAGGQGGCVPGSPACGLGETLDPSTQGAAFDPATGQWRTIAAAPHPLPQDAGSHVRSAWDGHSAVFAGSAVGILSPDYLALSYDPTTDQWSSEPFPGQAVSLTQSGSALVGASMPTAIPGSSTSLQAVRRSVTAAPFENVGAPITNAAGCWVQVQTTGPGVVVLDCGETERERADSTISPGPSGSPVTVVPPGAGLDSMYAFDAGALTWTKLPSARSDLQYLFWTDRGLLAIGRQHLTELTPTTPHTATGG